MKRTHFSQDTNSGSCLAAGKSKMVGCEPEVKPIDAGFDEHFAVLGYNVKSSDMTSVAQKLEQLEEVMGSSAELDAGQGPELASENVHYNPSDLSSWLESMICGFNPLPEFNSSTTTAAVDPFLESTRTLVESDFGTGLISILDQAVYPRIRLLPPPSSQPRQKKMKMAPYSGNSGVLTWASPEEPATRSLVLIDSQENGIRLVHTLKACAEAVQHDNKKLAEVLVKNIGFLALSQVGAMRKVATYFAEALARRIYDLHPANPPDPSFTDMLQMHFYAACPYLKFAHFTANRAILEAFEGKNRVHVIDFGIKQGMQWPELLQALAVRPGGPPAFRLTGIGPPSPENTDHLRQVGWKLEQFAEMINLEFEYKGFVADSLAQLHSLMLDIREGETLAVNSIFELHQLLATPGSMENVLQMVKEMKPQILTVVEQEANHNGPVFLDRFNESLHYYSTLFDSLENCCGDCSVSDEDKVMSEVYLGSQIFNIVACEGAGRVHRHENLAQWRTRFKSNGFEPIHLGSNMFKVASMLASAGGGEYRVEENAGCLMLGWHTRPLIATSAWKPG